MKGLLAYWETTACDHTETATDCNVALEKALRNLEVAITSYPLPTVLAEETMLIQLFQNLIANSIKYRGEEPARIHVSVEDGGPAALFSVREHGIGIDPQHFQRFFGISKRLRGKEISGTGIGLALCKKIVERRGGNIWVESEVGRGATFKFTIPRHRSLPSPRRRLSGPFLLEERGVIDLKGKGQVKTWFLACRSADVITMTAAKRRSAK
ncbi:MAG: hypothetical protein JJE04_25715 [Acidobacteriia bacterium]|nr:hypothetical protein [Terriglobia bacterium]